MQDENKLFRQKSNAYSCNAEGQAAAATDWPCIVPASRLPQCPAEATIVYVQAAAQPAAPTPPAAQGVQDENELFRQMSVVYSSNAEGQAAAAVQQAVEQPGQARQLPPGHRPRPAQAVVIEPDVMQVCACGLTALSVPR